MSVAMRQDDIVASQSPSTRLGFRFLGIAVVGFASFKLLRNARQAVPSEFLICVQSPTTHHS